MPDPNDEVVDHLDDCVELCCPDCGGESGFLTCIEDCCSCASGDECWVACPSCEGEG